ncbi:MAG: DASS family sodium-coupled anion symporter [Lachnospiraceae bacterium]|nr:DASS family sodium-coupled anion symporter [Lachnospiraceae bacterium]
MNALRAKQKYGLLTALLILVAMFFIPVPEGLTEAGIRTLSCTLALLVCLSTGALPLGLTSLIFMMLYYVLGAATSLPAAVSGMATPPVFFILASFGMSAAVSESPISRRILYFMLKVFGKSLKSTLLGLMFATAVVSAFISNVPVTAMFVTIGLAFLKLYKDEESRKQTGRTMMIAIPVAAMIGGIMTPVGSSPNLVAISTLKSMADYDISFVEWAAYGVPIALILIPLAWLIITRVFPPVELERERFRKFVEDSRVTEKVDRQEAKVICIMGTMIVLWILSSWIPVINLYVVAVLGVAVMFLPGVQVLDWENFKKNTNWDVVFVTASVISLGNIISETGLSTWVVNTVFPADLSLPAYAMVCITAVFVILMLLVVPISGALIQILAGPLIVVAANCGIAPVVLIVTLCFCATNCYLLPIDTVPLLAYSTGYFQMTDMPKATAPILLALALLCTLWNPLLCGWMA